MGGFLGWRTFLDLMNSNGGDSDRSRLDAGCRSVPTSFGSGNCSEILSVEICCEAAANVSLAWISSNAGSRHTRLGRSGQVLAALFDRFPKFGRFVVSNSVVSISCILIALVATASELSSPGIDFDLGSKLKLPAWHEANPKDLARSGRVPGSCVLSPAAILAELRRKF